MDERRDELAVLESRLDQVKALFEDFRRKVLAEIPADSTEERRMAEFVLNREGRGLRRIERQLRRMRAELG